MDSLNDWFPLDLKSTRHMYFRENHILDNGYAISVQASTGHYCSPRINQANLHDYESVEMAIYIPSDDGSNTEWVTAKDIPELSEWGWVNDDVAGWIPIGDIPRIMQLVRSYA